MNKKVVIGLSGGVDSAVSAYLLKQQGYEVIAVFMENWDDILNNDVLGHKGQFQAGCTSKQDFMDATKVAQHLNIEIHKVNFVNEYWNLVFKEFLEEYKNGLTPNPDVLCNRYIKFGAFKKYVEQEFHPDFIATGHYAGVINGNDAKLLKARDENKDQTYFLCDLSKEQLKNVIFPLKDYTKTEVRAIAKKINLPIWDKKDSTGICFIGERHFSEFLKNYLPNQPGKIVDIKTNKILGTHNGTMYFTIGQRSGLNLGGQYTRYFVCKKDLENKIVYVTSSDDEQEYLFHDLVEVRNLNKIDNVDWTNKNLQVRFRHRQKLIDCTILQDKEMLLIKCKDKVRAITPGQYAVFYDGEVCLGGGIINSSYKSN